MLTELLAEYVNAPLECDGLTRVLHTVLHQEGIEHSCMVGSLTYVDRNEGAPLHFWITLPDGRFIDFRAHMWLGDSAGIPHGIFDPANFPQVVYRGEVVNLEILPQKLFDVLVGKFP